MPLTATGMRMVMRQIQEVEAQPVDGVRLLPSEDLSELRFELDGPEGTPFAAGRFRVSLLFDQDYPEVPPKGMFRTRIFHPNVAERGEICVNALKRDWKPTLGLRHILLVIRCLLVEPNAESALNEEAGRLLLEDYGTYERKARMFTNIHARRPDSVPRFTAPDESAATTQGVSQGTTHEPNVAARAAATILEDATSASNATSEVGLNAPSTHGALSDAGCNGCVVHHKATSDAATASADKTKKKATEKKRNALRRI